MSFQPPKGTDDILAPRSQAWREALRSWEWWAERYGYPLISLPVFEATDLFERGVGDTTEVVTKQMYTFSDRGGRSVTLRPEGTAGVVRAYLNSGHQGVWKGSYSGPFFRYERPQAGRRRQFYQVGVEYLDSASPLADVEVIELGHRFISSLGMSDLTLLLNSIGDPECRPAYVGALRDYLRSKEGELSADSVALIDRNPLRVLDSKQDAEQLGDAPRTIDHLCEACKEHHDAVKAELESLGIPYVEEPSLVRGLDYYTRTAFEYVATGLDAAQNAVGGGGRYDGLAEAIGGRHTPGVGFALGIDRLMLALGEPESAYLDAYLVSETGPEEALAVASRLRVEGLRVDFDVDGRSVKAQFRTAGRLEVPVVLVWRGEGLPVDVQTQDERTELPLEEVSNWFRA
ncbi:MAG: histidine--tRNA ligase [Acidimicrobiia bacterium]|jgi:histidyl-tRNA synthetase